MPRSSAKTTASGKPGGGRKRKTPPQAGEPQLAVETLARAGERLGMSGDDISRILGVVDSVAEEAQATESVVDKYKADESALIQVLLEIQRRNRWLSGADLATVCERLGVPFGRAYRIATFYKAFSLTPRGRHSVSVCMGTACHVRGAPRLLDRVVEAIGVKPGETTDDQKFTLETVNCLGCCALGPVIVVDEEYHSNPSSKELDSIKRACD